MPDDFRNPPSSRESSRPRLDTSTPEEHETMEKLDDRLTPDGLDPQPGFWEQDTSRPDSIPERVFDRLFRDLESARGGGSTEKIRPEAPCLEMIGPYQIVAAIGTGGFGHVYVGVDPATGISVAVKIPRADRPGCSWTLKELWAGQKVHHPHVVPVRASGIDEGRPYLVSEFVHGPSLSAWLNQRGTENLLPFHAAASLVELLARGVDCCHRHGVLHRDLKPSNVILQNDDPGGPVIEGLPERLVPRITDFGLARPIIASNESGTLDHAGTPAYMAPEQAAGRKNQTAAVDIHALGVMLYELLTGAPPYRGESAGEILAKVVRDEPRNPRLLRSKLPRDLETICLKCLEKQPEKRYASAADLADDLKAFLERRPITARPISGLEKMGRWAVRKPTEAMLTAVAGLALVCLVVGAMFYVDSQGKTKRFLQRQVERTEQLLIAERLQDAQQEETGGNTDRALQLLHDLTQDIQHKIRPGFAWRVLLERLNRGLSLIWSGEPGLDALLMIPRDNQESLLAVRSNDSKTVSIWNPWAGTKLHQLPHTKIDWMSQSPSNGQLLLAQGMHKFSDGPLQKHIYEYDTRQFMPRKSFAIPSSMGNRPFHWPLRDNRLLMIGKGMRNCELRDRQTFQLLDSFELDGNLLTGSMSPDGNSLALCVEDQGNAWLEHLETLGDKFISATRLTGPYSIRDDQNVVCAFGPGGNSIAFQTSFDSPIVLFDLQNRQYRQIGVDTGVSQLCFSPRGDLLAFGTHKREVRIVNVHTGELMQSLHIPFYFVTGLEFDTTGRDLHAVSSFDPRIWTWHLDQDGRQLTNQELTSQLGVELNCVQFSSDGKTMAIADETGQVRFYPATGLNNGRIERFGNSGINSMAFLDNGRLMASSNWSESGIIEIREVATGRIVRTLAGHQRRVRALAISPDESFLVSASSDGTFRLWNLRAEDTESRIINRVENNDARCVAFSPDGRFVAMGDNERNLAVYDIRSGTLMQFGKRSRPIQAVVFSPRGDMLAFGDGTGSITLLSWPDRTERQIRAHPGSGGVLSLAFHPNGEELASGGDDGSVAIWDVMVGSELLRDQVHTGEVRGVAFDPDGSRLVSVDEKGGVHFMVARSKDQQASKKTSPE